jgi:2,3-bisphosphoglycerate-dependent phosphoglycerate mutase
MDLYLIRHAQSANNARPAKDRVEDPPLTEIGHQQCRHLGKWLRNLRLTGVITSPFLRALETADHIARAVRLTPQVRTDLHEQGGCVSGPSPDVYVGRPGMSRSQIERRFPGFQILSEIDGDGWWASKPSETLDAAKRRAERLLAQIVREHAQTQARLALVTHGDFQRLVIGQFHAGPLETPHNASVTRVVVGLQGCRLEEYGRVDYLPNDLFTV